MLKMFKTCGRGTCVAHTQTLLHSKKILRSNESLNLALQILIYEQSLRKIISPNFSQMYLESGQTVKWIALSTTKIYDS